MKGNASAGASLRSPFADEQDGGKSELTTLSPAMPSGPVPPGISRSSSISSKALPISAVALAHQRSIQSNKSGNASEGSSSLGRAKSVSSVSSVTSTSSLEAAPFRQAPLGNFRQGYGGRGNQGRIPQNQQGYRGGGGSGVRTGGMAPPNTAPPATSSFPQSGHNSMMMEPYNNFTSASEMVSVSNATTPGSEANVTLSSPLLGPPVLDGNSGETGTGSSNTNIRPPVRARVLPKATQDEWLYRNAPGLAGSSGSSSISGGIGNGIAAGPMAMKPSFGKLSIRNKIVRGAEKLGIKPLTTVAREQGPSSADSVNVASGGGSGALSAGAGSSLGSAGMESVRMQASHSVDSPGSGSGMGMTGPPIVTSSVTNAPLLVPKIPFGGGTGGAIVSLSDGVSDLRPTPTSSISADQIMTMQEAARRVVGAAEPPGVGTMGSEEKAKMVEDVEMMLRTPTRYAHPTFIFESDSDPAAAGASGTGSGANGGSEDADSQQQQQNARQGPLQQPPAQLVRRLTPAEQVKHEAQHGVARLPDVPDYRGTGEDLVPSSLATSLVLVSSNVSGRHSIISASSGATARPIQHDRPMFRTSLESAHSHSNSLSASPSAYPSMRAAISSSPTTLRRPPMTGTGDRTSVSEASSGLGDDLADEEEEERSAAMSRQGTAVRLSPKVPKLELPGLQPNTAASASSSSRVPHVRTSSTASGTSSVSDKVGVSQTATAAAPPAAVPSSQARPSSSSRTTRGPQDFDYGDVLGEGSYSTVIQAWDLLSNMKRGQEGEKRSSSITAAAAIAGVQRGDRSKLREGKKVYAVKVLDKVHILKQRKQKYVGVEKEALSRLIKLPGVVTLFWTFQDRDSLCEFGSLLRC